VEGGRDRDQFDQWELGFNFYPTDNVVLKFDYRDREHDLDSESGRDFNGFDLGVGYQF
jgi:opacity protein-like surface antigen